MPVIYEITDLTAPELDIYARLTQAQLRNRLEPEKGIFIAESPKVIARALDAGYQPLSLLMERRQITGPAQEILTRCGDVPVYTADRELLAQLTGFALTRGVLCAFRRPAPRTVEQVCAHARRVAVLEGIVDSTNVGAIFRSAAALNMDAVLITPSCCDPLCRRAVRVSMGTVFQVPWAQIGICPADWPENGSAQLHALGFKTAARQHHRRLRLHRKDPHVPWGGFPQRSRCQRRSLLAAWPVVSLRSCSPKLLDKRPKTRYTISVIIMGL